MMAPSRLSPSLQKPWEQRVDRGNGIRVAFCLHEPSALSPLTIPQDVLLQPWFVSMETGSSASLQA